MIITLTEAKQHLNIQESFLEDDTLITDLILVAENVIERDTQHTINSIEISEGSVPPMLKHAAKILVSTFYENREAVIIGVSVSEVPFSYKYLMSSYKKYTIK